MPQEETEPETEVEEETCEKGDHLSDLDEVTQRFISMFSTVRSKIEDLARAESDVKRFELSIESERKRLQKMLETAKVSLKNARIQMAAELAKADTAGFSKIAELVKEAQSA